MGSSIPDYGIDLTSLEGEDTTVVDLSAQESSLVPDEKIAAVAYDIVHNDQPNEPHESKMIRAAKLMRRYRNELIALLRGSAAL